MQSPDDYKAERIMLGRAVTAFVLFEQMIDAGQRAPATMDLRRRRRNGEMLIDNLRATALSMDAIGIRIGELNRAVNGSMSYLLWHQWTEKGTTSSTPVAVLRLVIDFRRREIAVPRGTGEQIEKWNAKADEPWRFVIR